MSMASESKNRFLNIAIDGPSGAGKSTLAKLLAKKLAILYLDTGFLYRIVAWLAKENGIEFEDEESLENFLQVKLLSFTLTTSGLKILYKGEQVDADLYNPELSQGASKVSQFPCVRSYLIDLQREIATNHCVVLDGRDIGTVVLPNADLKIYLTASQEERVKRRYQDHIATGMTLAEVEKEIVERDTRDSTRSVAPLKAAEDAIMMDSTNLSVEELGEQIEQILMQKGLWKGA